MKWVFFPSLVFTGFTAAVLLAQIGKAYWQYVEGLQWGISWTFGILLVLNAIACILSLMTIVAVAQGSMRQLNPTGAFLVAVPWITLFCLVVGGLTGVYIS